VSFRPIYNEDIGLIMLLHNTTRYSLSTQKLISIFCKLTFCCICCIPICISQQNTGNAENRTILGSQQRLSEFKKFQIFYLNGISETMLPTARNCKRFKCNGKGKVIPLQARCGRWVVSSTPRPHFTPGKDPVPIVQEAGCSPGTVWTSGKISSPSGFDPGPSSP